MYSYRALAAALLFCSLAAFALQADVPPLPATPKQPAVDEYHGVKVTDDYRWLENGKSPQVMAWTEAQDRHARALLDSNPLHAEIQHFLKKLADGRSPSFYDLERRGGLLFAMDSQPGKQQDMLVTLRSADELSSKHVVIDPSQLDPTNSTAIQFYEPSRDGSKVVISLAAGGTESGTLHIYDVASGGALPDLVPRVTGNGGGSVAWNADGSGIYYTRYPHEGERPSADMNFYEQVYFHKLGTPGAQDTYVIGKDLPRIAEVTLTTSDDGHYMLAAVENGDGGDYEHFLRDAAGKWTQLTQFSDQVKSIVFGDDALYLLSREHAPQGKILRLPLANPEFQKATTIIPQSPVVLQELLITPNQLYVTEQVGGPTEIHVFDHSGHALGTVPAEPVSSVTQMLRWQGDQILFGNISYVDPMAWYYFDPKSNKTSITAMRESSPVSFADVEAVRELAVSKDGTNVPVTIIRRKGTKLDGQNPTILNGYGGFDVSQGPFFDPSLRAWLDAGGVFAISNLRGGGEFGEEWHIAGMLTHKQNVFDDFIASAELLIKAGYTNPSKFGIEGGSNGGLLMGAALTQRPELFRAVVSVAGLYDMLRSETTENGQFNTTEYGSVKDPEQFKALYAYSPYNNVRDGVKYPSVLFEVGENDPRVDPWHSRKMTARLQAATASSNPVLLISFSNAGHGGIGSAEDPRIAMDTYLIEFLLEQLGARWAGSGGM